MSRTPESVKRVRDEMVSALERSLDSEYEGRLLRKWISLLSDEDSQSEVSSEREIPNDASNAMPRNTYGECWQCGLKVRNCVCEEPGTCSSKAQGTWIDDSQYWRCRCGGSPGASVNNDCASRCSMCNTDRPDPRTSDACPCDHKFSSHETCDCQFCNLGHRSNEAPICNCYDDGVMPVRGSNCTNGCQGTTGYPGGVFVPEQRPQEAPPEEDWERRCRIAWSERDDARRDVKALRAKLDEHRPDKASPDLFQAGMQWAKEFRKHHWLSEEGDWDAVLDFMARAFVAGAEKRVDYPQGTDPRTAEALSAWARWYSGKLDRGEGYSGAEDDLFQVLGCVGVPAPRSDLAKGGER